MITLLDYGAGNVRSVINAIESLGETVKIVSSGEDILSAEKLVFPGVGAFGSMMHSLHKKKYTEPLMAYLHSDRPFLGICLGMQLLAKSSNEHGHYQGLGWIDGDVTRFHFNGTGQKLPHMGWNDIALKKEHPLFAGLEEGQFTFYFVHSYHMTCARPETAVASCEYGYRFTAAVARDNIVATQFHPEKSQDNGIQILENFVRWNP